AGHGAAGVPRPPHLCRRGLESRLGGAALHRSRLRARPPGRAVLRRPGCPHPPDVRTGATGARPGPRPARPGRSRGGDRAQLHPGASRPQSEAGPHGDAALGAAVRDRRQPGGRGPGGKPRPRGPPGGLRRRAAAGRKRPVIRRLVVLALLVGGAVLLEPLRAPTEGVIAPRSLFLFGILLLTADTFGALAHDSRLPRLVGYLLAGLALGPSVTGIVPAGVLEDLGMMKRLAVGLIGLLAGAELRIADLRQRHRAILWILLLQGAAVLAALWAATLLARSWIPFLAGLEPRPLLFVSLLFAATLTVNSPMVTLALLTETKAVGPLAKTTLGVVLVADVAVILLFTAAFSLAQSSLGGAAAG